MGDPDMSPLGGVTQGEDFITGLGGWSNMSNFTTTAVPHRGDSSTTVTTLVTVPIYGLMCAIGLIGNGLVVFVITRYTKMKTVTNLYILNLSSADFLFLVGMPLIMTTAILKSWIFGAALCKIYHIFTCINWFTGAFTLTVMSADRFLAVVYPIASMRYRTPKYAIGVIVLIWLVSFFVMLPVVLYAKNQPRPSNPDYYTCGVEWPSENPINGYKIFMLYILMVGFVIPVLLICLFYTLLLCRLRATGPRVRSGERRRSHRKVTKLVTLIITVYIICWLPYWVFQLHIVFAGNIQQKVGMVSVFTVLTLLSYANSMINPLLYAFTNESFRESFISAFKCASDPILLGRRGSEYVSGLMSANNNSIRHNNHGGQYNHLTPVAAGGGGGFGGGGAGAAQGSGAVVAPKVAGVVSGVVAVGSANGGDTTHDTDVTDIEHLAEYEFAMPNSTPNGGSPAKTPSAANGETSPALSSNRDEEKMSCDV